MARSKRVLFDEDEQLVSQLCHAMSHPARVRIISKLVNGEAQAYSLLIAGIPLDERTCMQHISLLERLQFLKPALLHTKRGGYRLNLQLFRACSMASRRMLRVDGTVRSITNLEESEEVG